MIRASNALQRNERWRIHLVNLSTEQFYIGSKEQRIGVHDIIKNNKIWKWDV